MGTGEKKQRSYPKESLEMGIGEKKMRSYPKGKLENGYRKKKWIEIPKRKENWKNLISFFVHRRLTREKGIAIINP